MSPAATPRFSSLSPDQNDQGHASSGSRWSSASIEREAALRAFLDAVLHRRVALLSRGEAHRLGQLRPVAEILELERLQVVLERLHEPFRRLDLAEFALDDAEGGAEAVACRPDGRPCPRRRCRRPTIRGSASDPSRRRRRACAARRRSARPDLQLVRGGDGGLVHRQLTAFFTSALILASSAAVSFFSARRPATWSLRRGSRCR